MTAEWRMVARREVFTVVASILTPRIREDTDLSYQSRATAYPFIMNLKSVYLHHSDSLAGSPWPRPFGYGCGTSPSGGMGTGSGLLLMETVFFVATLPIVSQDEGLLKGSHPLWSSR